MKPMVVDVQRYGSLGGEEVAMTFDENSIAHIMSVLTDLYSDSEMAVIREYSTNAYDSHVAAGVQRPIEITKPTHLDPTLRIKDYGIGMSREDIINIYSKYGASTKRDTNDQTGTLGLGCKSALTYTSQFTVTAVKNGIKTIINVSRASDGTGLMELVDTVPTTEPNGVTISIPVSVVNSMCSKIDEFFAYWKPGTVKIDNQLPTTIKGIDITDNIKLVDDANSDIIVMGNVPYRVDRDHEIVSGNGWGWRGYGVVAWVPIGTVAFTPNREDLRYTEQTCQAINAIREEFIANLNSRLNDVVQKAPTAAAALKQYVECLRYNSIGGLNLKKEWRGKSFSDDLAIKHMVFDRKASRYQISRASHIEPSAVFNSVFITGFKNTSLPAAYKRKIRKMLDSNSPTNVRLIETDSLSEWFDEATVYTWDDVRAVSLSDGVTARSCSTGPQLYKVLNTALGYFEEKDSIDPLKPIYFDTQADYRGEGGFLSKYFDEDDQVILLSRNRWDKFQRTFPSAKRIHVGMKIKKQEFVDSLPEDVVLSLTLNNSDALQSLDEAKVDDPELKTHITAAKMDCSKYRKKFILFADAFERKESALSKYSLIEPYFMRLVNKKHLYIYLNATYNELFKESQ